MNMKFEPVNDGKRAHEKIADQIKKAIFDNQFKPGGRLPSERELTTIFNASRVTIRQAILSLKKSGLLFVKIGTGGGTFVSEAIGESEIIEIVENVIKWNRTGIQDVIQLREMMEPKVAYLAAQNASSEDIKMIRDVLNDPVKADSGMSAFTRQDERFHKALAKAVGNPILAVFQAAMIDIWFKFVHEIKWDEDPKKHMKSNHTMILDEIEARNPEGAKRAMLSHLNDMKILLSKLSKNQLPTKYLDLQVELKV